MDGMPEGNVVTDLKYNATQSLITAGTYGRGAWQTSIDPVQPIAPGDLITYVLHLDHLGGTGSATTALTDTLPPELNSSFTTEADEFVDC